MCRGRGAMNKWLTLAWWRYQVGWRLIYWRLKLSGATVVWTGPMRCTYEAGDCFPSDIEAARALGCTVQEGEWFGMWGRWIYELPQGGGATLLIGLCTKTLGSDWEPRAFLARPGCEETVRRHNFKKEGSAEDVLSNLGKGSSPISPEILGEREAY